MADKLATIGITGGEDAGVGVAVGGGGGAISQLSGSVMDATEASVRIYVSSAKGNSISCIGTLAR
ncbi:hypothetical protein CCACVL1_15478 [Corchorus capsularis]|uniref:Uncharacterized protein n=1 Tax=Corchorus capsularis TaxID=210143 RepID=A0A1R3I2B7_COCAP|nr:hypothetical protein CCACVL1_15478 [Corchorus capsularis]